MTDLDNALEALWTDLDKGEDVLGMIADLLVDQGVLHSADELLRYDPTFTVEKRKYSWWKQSQIQVKWNWMPQIGASCVLSDAIWERLSGNREQYKAGLFKTYVGRSAAYQALLKALRS